MVKTLDLSRNLYKQKRKRLWLYINLQKKGAGGLSPVPTPMSYVMSRFYKPFVNKKNSAGLKTETYRIFPQSLKSTCRQFRICLRCLFANETYAKECPELYCKWSTLKTEKIPRHVTFLSMDYLYRSLKAFHLFLLLNQIKHTQGKCPI